MDTEVLPLIPADLKTVLKKNRWRFDWKSELKYEDRQLYKLLVKAESNIQGLINLQPVENFVECTSLKQPRTIMVVRKSISEWQEIWWCLPAK